MIEKFSFQFCSAAKREQQAKVTIESRAMNIDDEDDDDDEDQFHWLRERRRKERRKNRYREKLCWQLLSVSKNFIHSLFITFFFISTFFFHFFILFLHLAIKKILYFLRPKNTFKPAKTKKCYFPPSSHLVQRQSRWRLNFFLLLPPFFVCRLLLFLDHLRGGQQQFLNLCFSAKHRSLFCFSCLPLLRRANCSKSKFILGKIYNKRRKIAKTPS